MASLLMLRHRSLSFLLVLLSYVIIRTFSLVIMWFITF